MERDGTAADGPWEDKAVSALAKEIGITEQTLYIGWRELKSQRLPGPGNGKSPRGMVLEDKFPVVLEIAALNEAELAEYCRHKGLYVEQIAVRRQACRIANANANANAAEQVRSLGEQTKEDRNAFGN